LGLENGDVESRDVDLAGDELGEQLAAAAAENILLFVVNLE
jgi:hypothetical protein